MLGRLPKFEGVEPGDVLGIGGQAIVLSGRRAGEDVALKVSIDGAIDRLAREADALERIGPPHAPRLLERHASYLVLERLRQPSIANLLAAATSFGGDELVRLARALYTALEAIHARGVVHGDLSPDNLMFDGRTITVIDFGLAREQGAKPITLDLGAGTLHYMAPEVLRGMPASAASDVYSAAAVLYELAAGLPPFIGDPTAIERAIAFLVPAPLPALGSAPWLFDALHKDPTRRPTARSLVELAVTSTGPPVGAMVSSPPPPVRVLAGSFLAANEPAVHESVALLAVSGVSLPVVDRLVSAARGYIVKQRGPRAVAVFSARDRDAPLQVALDAARTLVAQGGRCAVHVAPVELRRSARPPHRASGAVLETLEAWWPAGAAPLHVTAEAAALLEDIDLPLVGRDRLLDTVSEALRRTTRSGLPTVVTILGDRGIGKTRLARALVHRLAEHARVIEIGGAAFSLSRLAEVLANTIDGGPAMTLANLGTTGAPNAGLLPTNHHAPIAIVIDDGHLVDPAILAAFDGLLLDDRPLCVAMIADRELLEVHPGWGVGVGDAEEHVLGPLDRCAGIDLARAAIDHEFCPVALLEHLHAIARGHPRTLIDISRLARTPGDAFDPRSVTTDWLVARALDQLPPELQRFVGVLAVAGSAITSAELDVIGSLDAGPRIDVGAALATLVASGMARPSTHARMEGWELQPVALASVATSRVDVELRHRIHKRVRELLADRSGDPAEIARHAISCGDTDTAVALYADLAEGARARHRTFEAERWADRILAIATASDPRRFEAALLRASMRYRRHRIAEALTDLELAREAHDPLIVARADLEAGIVHDWAHDFRASWECAVRAREIQEPAIVLGVRLAEGRRAFREQRLVDAAAILREVVGRARELEHPGGVPPGVAARMICESALIARLLLAPTLAWLGELDEAEAQFDEVIATCHATGDRLHEAVALANRSFLWYARQRPDDQRADLERCIKLARELGNPLLERVPAWNLAEILYWAGRDAEARRYQRRTAELAAKFVKGHVPDDALLEARLAIVNGDAATATDRLDWIDRHCTSSSLQLVVRLLVDAIRAVLAKAPTSVWKQLTDDALQLPEDERVEIWFLRSLVHPTDRTAMSHLRDLAARWPIWTARLAGR